MPVALVGDEAGEQLDDLLLPRGGLVEPAPHLGEPSVHLGEPPARLLESGGRLHAEGVDRGPVRIDLYPEVGEVAVASVGEVTGGCGVGGHHLHAGFQRAESGFDVGRVGHGQERTGLSRPARWVPHNGTWSHDVGIPMSDVVGVVVVVEGASGVGAGCAAVEHEADVVLMDLLMPGGTRSPS